MPPLPDGERAALEQRLEELVHVESGLTSKEALRTVQYEIAEIRWKLGLLSDDEFAEIEEFLAFNFDF